MDNAETVPLYFAQEFEGLKGPRKFECMNKIYMESYMACNGQCFIVYWILCQADLKEVGLTQNWEHNTSKFHNPYNFCVEGPT